MLREKLKVNRELTTKERAMQLKQKKRIPISTEILYDNFSVIKFNSTYLETTDKYYQDRGYECLAGILCALGTIFALIAIPFFIVYAPVPITDYISITVLSILIILLCMMLHGTIKMLKLDCFNYTHYPIRFNRKTKKVYVFLQTGKIITANWQDLFFTLGIHQNLPFRLVNEDIKAHILAEDGKTILQSFELGICSTDMNVLTYWEFIRRYMEEGPKQVKDAVLHCLPITEQRAKAIDELYYSFADLFYRKTVVLPMITLILLTILPRILAMKTCKIPHFPAEIEEESVVEPNDPYIITPAINQAWSWKTGWTKHRCTYKQIAEYFAMPETRKIVGKYLSIN